MALIAVAEDDPGTLKLISVVLKNIGHEVLAAPDGAAAWDLITAHAPELVVSDIHMPRMSGFDLLDALRGHPTLGATPLILLTSLQEREHMRQGMRQGADDYLTKPFQTRELRDAVMAQLNKQQIRQVAQDLTIRSTLTAELEKQLRTLGDAFEDRLALALNQQWPTANAQDVQGGHEQATVLAVCLRNHAAWSSALPAADLSVLLRRFHQACGDTVFLFGATTLQFLGDVLVAVFADVENDAPASHPLRAVRAAFGVRNSLAGLQAFAEARWVDHAPPPLEVGSALHSGPVAMMRLDGLLGGAAQLIPVGETVDNAVALARHPDLHEATYPVASVEVLRSVTGVVQTQPRLWLELPQRGKSMDVSCLMPLRAAPDSASGPRP
ncbi:response regulator [Hydrogenophaga sp.]|uniref:response regulator n=1 Tax=Hydrogenophaga sp. TaxID=1904254 RepID=UPI0025C134E0|nr:response regulator [Hydrogenophaga sp.]